MRPGECGECRPAVSARAHPWSPRMHAGAPDWHHITASIAPFVATVTTSDATEPRCQKREVRRLEVRGAPRCRSTKSALGGGGTSSGRRAQTYGAGGINRADTHGMLHACEAGGSLLEWLTSAAQAIRQPSASALARNKPAKRAPQVSPAPLWGFGSARDAERDDHSALQPRNEVAHPNTDANVGCSQPPDAREAHEVEDGTRSPSRSV